MTRLLRRRRGHRTRGQSLVEFALVLPVLLFVTMVAIDFGRIYLGYVNLQNMARIGANFAANHATAWGSPGNAAVRTQYQNQIKNDALATNCALPVVSSVSTAPDPTFTDNGGNGTATDVGDSVSVQISCTFRVVTPFISAIFGSGGNIGVSAMSQFPVKTGLIAAAAPGTIAPTADFSASPTTGPAPLSVRFTDASTGGPTAWSWDFDSDGTIDSTAQDPLYVYGAPGIYTVTMYASNSAGVSAPRVKTNYISASLAPATVDFTATPTSGTRPLAVQFTDTSTGAPTSWEWDFDNNGTPDSTLQNPTYTYTSVGTYTVKLTTTNAGGPASKTVPNMINVGVGTCPVPNFANTSSSAAQGTWNLAGFTTTVIFRQGNLPWTVISQSLQVGLVTPCNSSITLSKN